MENSIVQLLGFTIGVFIAMILICILSMVCCFLRDMIERWNRKTPEQWFKRLPEGYRQLAQKYINPEFRNYQQHPENIEWALYNSFDWKKTAEGKKFWWGVYGYYFDLSSSFEEKRALPQLLT